MKKYDIIVVGELNVDLILNNIQGFPVEGKEILADEMNLTLGSSSAIFASNISTLGAKTAFIGKIGIDTFGNLTIDSLHKRKVDTDLIIRSKDHQTGATIVLNYGEDRAMVTHQGAMAHLGIDDISEAEIKKAKHLHVSSIFLQPLIKKDIIQIFKMAKDNGLTTSLDIQWDPEEKWDVDFKSLLPFVDVFLPNRLELLAITKASSIDEAIDFLMLYANHIIVKMGNEGSRGYFLNERYDVPAFKNEEVIDAIGAGDSFNAGFISKFIQGEKLEDCLRFGNLIGAINTCASGGTTAFKNMKRVTRIAEERFGMKI